MFAKLKVVAIGILTVLSLILAAFLKGRSGGKAEVVEEVRQQEVKDVKAVAEKRVENAKVVKDVQQEVVSSGDSSVDDELLNNWTRPDSRK